MESFRERRERLGYTQKVLAGECGVHFTHICHIERGNANPSLEVFVKLVDKLDVSPAKLLDMLKHRSGTKSAASVTDIQKARERRKRR